MATSRSRKPARRSARSSRSRSSAAPRKRATAGSRQPAKRPAASGRRRASASSNRTTAGARRPAAQRGRAAAPRGRASNGRRRRRRSPLPFIIAIICVIGLIVGITHCGHRPDDTQSAAPANNEVSMAIDDSRDLYAEPYDWNDLSKSGQMLSYAVDGETKSSVGVDVSEHQGDIDWQKFADQGVQFAYIRVGYRSTDKGVIAKDARFDDNLKGARDAGLKIGVYFYSMAINEDEAREEADFVCDTIGSTQLDYPIAFDLEPSQSNQTATRIDDLSPSQMTSIAQAFCDRVIERGHKAVIYGSQFDLNHLDLEKLKGYGFWYAEYENEPSSPLSFGIWQYSASSELEGCDEKVDLNLDLTDVLHDKLKELSDGRAKEGSSSGSDSSGSSGDSSSN